MSAHEQFAEDLALYALGTLEGEERATLERHLAGCSSCRVELEQLRGDGALLALSTAGPKPPARARQRLLEAVAKESGTKRPGVREAETGAATASSGKIGWSWWGVLGWAVAAVVIVSTASLWKENADLKQEARKTGGIIGQQQLELASAEKFVSTITNPQGQHFTLVSTKTPPQPQGKAFYLKDQKSLVFLASNMPALPKDKAYELWLIPVKGSPIPAGVFKPDEHGSAILTNPPLPEGAEAKAFAITVETEAGSETPTMPIVMMGAGE